MSIPWTRAVTGWTQHAKVIELSTLEPVEQYEIEHSDRRDDFMSITVAVGILSRVRDYAAAYAEDGNLAGHERRLAAVLGVSAKYLCGDASADCPRTVRGQSADTNRTSADVRGQKADVHRMSGSVLGAMVEAGILDANEDGSLVLHGWVELYKPVIDGLKKKAKDAARKRESRAETRPRTVRGRPSDVRDSSADSPRTSSGPSNEKLEVEKLEVRRTTSSSTPSTGAGTNPRKKLGDSPADCAQRLEELPNDQRQVWDRWFTLTGRTASMRLTAKRARYLRRQVEAHGLERCLSGMERLAQSAHHAGQNDAGKRYDDWHNAPLCDPGKFEGYCEAPRVPAPGAARAAAGGVTPDELERICAEAEAQYAAERAELLGGAA